MSTDMVMSIRKLVMKKTGPAARSHYITTAGTSGTNGEQPRDLDLMKRSPGPNPGLRQL